GMLDKSCSRAAPVFFLLAATTVELGGPLFIPPVTPRHHVPNMFDAGQVSSRAPHLESSHRSQPENADARRHSMGYRPDPPLRSAWPPLHLVSDCKPVQRRRQFVRSVACAA